MALASTRRIYFHVSNIPIGRCFSETGVKRAQLKPALPGLAWAPFRQALDKERLAGRKAGHVYYLNDGQAMRVLYIYQY